MRGRRPDGYHELASLVSFTGDDVSDELALDPSRPMGVTANGPHAPTLAGENLVAVAMARALAADPGLKTGAVTLNKQLPVAAGVGGGSADAAAVLRLLRRLNPERAATIDWPALALSLGADVPVCLESRAAFMTGIGEQIAEMRALPPLDAVLVNPLVAVPADKTAQVFRRLGAAALPPGAAPASPPGPFADRAALVGYLAAETNDLEPAAQAVVPAVVSVMTAIQVTAGCRLARMSGGGPTAFGIYDDRAAAETAAAALRRHKPGWWIVATTLS